MSDFLAELLKRFLGKTPWFFKVVQVVSAVIAIVMLLPDIMDGLTGAGIELPETWGQFVTKAVGVAAAVSAFIAQLTVTTEAKKENDIPD